jgi:hypothetical protein
LSYKKNQYIDGIIIIIVIIMPPSVDHHHHPSPQHEIVVLTTTETTTTPTTSTSFPLCCAFPVGEIEVQAIEDDEEVEGSTSNPHKKKGTSFATRIFMLPGNSVDENDYSNKTTTSIKPPTDERQDNDEDAASPSSSPSRYDYFVPRSPGGRSLADSFDSTDEIVENSDEAKLMKRVVERRVDHCTADRMAAASSSSPLQRQDSMSDCNSVNSNDVFMIDESQELEYLEVLDEHLMETNPEETNYARMEFDMDDFHPRKHQANLDDIIEHLCAAPCGECLPESPFASRMPSGYPRSVLRKSRYTSSFSSSFPAVPYDEAIVISSSNKSVRFQNVNIREFKMTLGNHPSATSGPPVMLDSEPFSPPKVMALDDYETCRPPRRKRRQLKLTLQQRHNILVKERGFRFEEVKTAWQEALEIRKQRKETLERGCVVAYCACGHDSRSWLFLFSRCLTILGLLLSLLKCTDWLL